MTRRGKVYTPAATHEYEQVIAAAYDGPMFTGPVFVSVTFSTSCATVYIADLDSPKASLTGDADNYVKALLDGLNGHAWADDRCVQKLHVRKR